MKQISCLLVALFSSLSWSHATHVRGGYIRVISSSTSLAYKFEVVMFNNSGSFTGFGGAVDFGDGTLVNLEEAATNHTTNYIDTETAINKFVINHTYQAPGAYTVGIREFFRSAGVLNMANSVETPFFASTAIIADPFLGTNTTPAITLPPAFFVKAGSRFFSSVNYKDEEEDSLVYSLSAPLKNYSDPVFDFVWPNNDKFYNGENRTDKPVFTLDKLSGQLTWDTPLLPGEFALAYKVLEYRKIDGIVYKLSETIIDLQLINLDSEHAPPGIDFKYQVSEEGQIDFTVDYLSTATDSIEWAFYCNCGMVTIGDANFETPALTDTAVGSKSLAGFTLANPQTDKPVVFVVAARSLDRSNPFRTIKSFAVNPAGKEYVLTAVKKPALADKILIYPNPASVSVSIQFPDTDYPSGAEIQLINAAGQSILKSKVSVNGNLATLNLEDLPGGIYLVRTQLDNQFYYSRIIKQ